MAPFVLGAHCPSFTNWLGDLPIGGAWPTAALDLLVLVLLWHALALRRAGYRWWAWPLPAATLVLALSALTAVNAWSGAYPDIRALVS